MVTTEKQFGTLPFVLWVSLCCNYGVVSGGHLSVVEKLMRKAFGIYWRVSGSVTKNMYKLGSI